MLANIGISRCCTVYSITQMVKVLRRIVMLKWQIAHLEERIRQLEYKAGINPVNYKYKGKNGR